VNSFADTIPAKFPMYVVRALGGILYLGGAIIMAWNLWMTAYGRVRLATIPTPAE
jgi:cytochrome c oxidase cbb3-type subunit 1